MKLEIIAPVEGKSWKIGHTVLISDQKHAFKLIEDGVAIHHPTVTDPPPNHECPCQDKEEPCDDCDQKEIPSPPKKKATRKKKNPIQKP